MASGSISREPPHQGAWLKGTYDHTIFANDESGWTVGVMRAEGHRDLITVVGAFTAIPGEGLTLEGKWISHKKFGDQFEVSHCQAESPSTMDGLRKYLASGMIKGIGPVYAEKLLERFGVDVCRVIEENPKRLREVSGIGAQRAKAITEAWSSQKAIKNIMVFLQGHGVGTAFAVKIYKYYRENAIERVKENPYGLATDISGIGFKTSDKIAGKLGIAKDAPIRARAGLHYILEQMSEREGHVLAPREILVTRAVELLEVDQSIVETAADDLASEVGGPIIVEKGSSGVSYALRALWRAEVGIAEELKRLNAAKFAKREIQWDKFVEWLESQSTLRFSQAQCQAIRVAYESKVSILTGGPGTGKSTLVRALTLLLSKIGVPFELAAPTGRAAKRLQEVTGKEARTIHRLLEFDAGTRSFRRGKDEPLEAELVLVDEFSMVDTRLFHSLLKALSDRARLVLVGDADQLPSVGAGDVLSELMTAGVFPVTRLTEIFRQASGSRITVSAHQINRGEFDYTPAPKEEKRDFYFLEREEPEDCLSTVLGLVTERIPSRLGISSRDIQVLLPMHRGTVGTVRVNQELQRIFNSGGRSLEHGARRFIVGDRVIQTRNDYDREVFNGDIGTVEAITEEGELIVSFEGRSVSYETSDLNELDLAYAVSIHKSQGSEFRAVIIPLLMQHAILLHRNLLYTAVTRGRELVIVVGSRRAVSLAVSRATREKRFTRLAERLSAASDAG